MVDCSAKHTVYNPEGDKWRCPKCGQSDMFSIEEGDEAANPECPRLHATDGCYCHRCGDGWSGATVSKRLAKIDNAVPCPHCHGRGTVPASAQP